MLFSPTPEQAAHGEMAEEKKEEQGSWGIFSFLQPQNFVDKDGDGKDDNTGMTQAEMAEVAAAPEESKLLHLTAEQIENFEAAAVVDALLAAVETTPDINVMLIEVCCKRLRVLCREPENCKKCDEAGSARAVVGAMGALPDTPTVQLQALAALVNLCSGEANEHRKNAVESGAMKAITAAMTKLPDNAEVQEMACIALQNCCYGEDPHATTRRERAAEEGALKTVLDAIKRHQASAPMQEVGAATLRLMVHRVHSLRDEALKLGAQPEWVKPIREGGGILSFRKVGFGTSRRKQKAAS